MEKHEKKALNKQKKLKLKKVKVLAFLLVFAMLLSYINAPFTNKSVLAAENTGSNPDEGGHPLPTNTGSETSVNNYDINNWEYGQIVDGVATITAYKGKYPNGAVYVPNAADFKGQGMTEVNKVVLTCDAVKNLDAEKLTSFEISKNGDKKVEASKGSWGQAFKDKKKLQTIDLKSLDTSNITNMFRMFDSCKSLINLDLSSFNTSKVINMQSMFESCNELINLDLSKFDTSKVINMQSMFEGCNKLTNLDLSHFKTSEVIYMQGMFRACKSLTNLDLSNFETNKVKDMGNMFVGCDNLTSINLSSKFDTSNVTNMTSMFENCKNLISLDVSNFDTSKVTNMENMFKHCNKLINLDVFNFDISNSKIDNMFEFFYEELKNEEKLSKEKQTEYAKYTNAGKLRDRTVEPIVKPVHTQSLLIEGEYNENVDIVISYNDPVSNQKIEKSANKSEGKWTLNLDAPLPLKTEIKIRQKEVGKRWSKEKIIEVQACQADTEIKLPTEKVKVEDSKRLTNEDKDKVKEAIKNVNPDKNIKEITFSEKGEITIKF